MSLIDVGDARSACAALRKAVKLAPHDEAVRERLQDAVRMTVISAPTNDSACAAWPESRALSQLQVSELPLACVTRQLVWKMLGIGCRQPVLRPRCAQAHLVCVGERPPATALSCRDGCVLKLLPDGCRFTERALAQSLQVRCEPCACTARVVMPRAGCLHGPRAGCARGHVCALVCPRTCAQQCLTAPAVRASRYGAHACRTSGASDQGAARDVTLSCSTENRV